MTTTAPTSLPSFAFGHDYVTMSGTEDGGTEIPGCYTVASTYYLPDTVGGSDGWYVAANKAWLVSDQWGQAMTTRGYAGASAYPAGPNTLALSQATLYKVAGTSLDCKNFWVMLIFDNSVRGTDVDGAAGSDEAYLFELFGKFKLSLTPDGLLKVSSTSGGGTSTMYVHAGINAVVIRSGAGSVKIDSYHFGATTVAAVGATGSTNIINLLDSNAGGAKFKGKLRGDYWGTDATISDATVTNMLNWAAARWGLATFTHGLVWLGDSESQNFYGVPGASAPGNLALARPKLCVMNCAHSGATIATTAHGGQAAATGGTLPDHQIPRAQNILTYLQSKVTATASKLGAVVWAGKNDATNIANSTLTLENCLSDLDGVYSSLTTAGVGKIVGVCPSTVAQVSDSDAKIQSKYSTLQSIRTHIKGYGLAAVVDINGKNNSGGGTAAECKAVITGSNEFWEPTTTGGSTDLVAPDAATSADGLHKGPLGQIADAAFVGATVNGIFGAYGVSSVLRDLLLLD